MTPKVDVFVTSYISSPAIRSRHDRVKRHLQSARVQFETHDVAASEEAKSYWLRKERSKDRELPCILVDGEWVGTVEQLDEAVEFGELRQFLRFDAPPPATTSDSSSNTTSKSPNLDDFSSLDLTDAELAELQKEIEVMHPSPGFTGTLSGATQSFVPTAPLTFKPRNTEEKIKVVRALGDRGALNVDHGGNDDDLDGIELTDAEAEELARELGLDSRDLLATPASSYVALPPSTTSKDITPSTTSSTTTALPTTPTPLNDKHPSVSGAGGAELSAPISEVEQLKLTPEEVTSLKTVPLETGGKLDIEPITEFEKTLREETAKSNSSAGGEKLELEEEEKEGKTTKEQLEHLKEHLGKEEYDYSDQVPKLDIDGMDDKVVKAVKDGIL